MTIPPLAVGIAVSMLFGFLALAGYCTSKGVRNSFIVGGYSIYLIAIGLFGLPQLFIYHRYSTASTQAARDAYLITSATTLLLALALLYGTVAVAAPESSRRAGRKLKHVLTTPIRITLNIIATLTRLTALLRDLYAGNTPTTNNADTPTSSTTGDTGTAHATSDTDPDDDTPGTSTPDTTPNTGPTTPSTASDSPDGISASLSQSPSTATDADIEDAITDTDSDRDAQLPPGHAADADTANQSPI